MNHSRAPALAGAAALLTAATHADEVLFQSATLGPTGITELSPETPGSNVNEFLFIGARFELTQPAVTSQIGGHFFASQGSSDFFGAVVALDGPNDFPNSGDLSTDDVRGATTLAFPSPSDEVLGMLELALEPGWYGVFFGSGVFGADGAGATVRNGVASSDASLFGGFNGDWGNQSTSANYRLVVRGFLIPEPPTLLLLLPGLVIGRRTHR